MKVVIGEQWRAADYGGGKPISTPFGEFVSGEVIDAPIKVAEWLIHNQLAEVARNWRWPGEKVAPKP